MSDDAQPSSTSTHDTVTSSYGICPGCGMNIHHAQDQCPECGAMAHETGITHPRHPGTPFFSLVVAGILAACLSLLSVEKEEFARAEQAHFRRWTGEQIQPPRQLQPLESPPASPPEFIPAQAPTPKPSPTPVPPPPTPTPAPFSPEEMGIPVVPDPEPEPEPDPEPEPEPRPLSTLKLRDQLAEEFTRELDEKYPMAKVGDTVELSFADNRTIRGRIRRFDSLELMLETHIGQRGVPYRLLSRESRMRVDRGERTTWAQEKAVQEVLNRRSQ